MFKLKHRFPIALPQSGNSARLPALIVLVLAAMAVLQLALPYANDLPMDGGMAGPARIKPPPQVPRIIVPVSISDRDLFSPDLAASTAAAAPTDVLGGAVIAGTVQRGRGLLAVVQERSGKVRYVGPGGQIAGWRISRLTANGVTLARGAETITAAYGASPSPAAAPAAENSEEDQ